MAIRQIRKPGRERPYVTLIDTGLAMRAQNILAGLACGKEDPEGGWPTLEDYSLDQLVEVANALALEIERRTF